MKFGENAHGDDISIYTDEPDLYYPRPRLYEVISGQKEPEEIYSFPQQLYEARGAKPHLNKKVLSLDADRKQILLEDHSRIGYDKLLLANGARPSVPPVEGVEKKGVFTLRTVADALAIRERAKKAGKAIVIGGGLLGLEFAACLRKASKQVHVVEIGPRILPRQLDQEGAEILQDELRTLSISVSTGVRASEILGKDEVTGVSLSNGEELPAGLVLIAAGIRPNVGLAADAGIKVNKGVIADEHLQTSANDVYAAGDVSEFNGTVYGIIPAAIEQAETASFNMLGREEHVYEGTVATTTLKIAGISLTSMGLISPEGSGYEEIKRVSRQGNVYKKIVLEGGKIVGAIILGERKDAAAMMKLMDEKTVVTKYKDHLLEEDFDYRKIIP
jgi:nitrite reductase (NADH) large subunit